MIDATTTTKHATVRLPEVLRAQVEQLWEELSADDTPSLLPIRRTLSKILQTGIQSPAFWREFSGGEAHARHAVRVCMLSLLIGESLGLDRAVLRDLGVAALVHDVGYAREGADVDRRSSHSVRLMLRVEDHYASKVRWLTALLSQSRSFGGDAERPHVLGRILRVAEDYDDLCRSMCPATALSMMGGSVGTSYDPVVFQALANQLGRFPAGTWLELTNGETVQVTGLAREGLFDTPVVRNLFGRKIDLASTGHQITRLIGHPSVT